MPNDTLALALLCAALVVSTSPGSAERANAVIGCENARTYVQRFADLELFTGQYECQEGLLWMTVSNRWFGFACHEQEQLYIVVRDGWRAQNGSNIIFRDIVGTTVAEFRVISSRPKIRDC